MHTYEVLEKALALIERKKNWRQITALAFRGDTPCCCTHGTFSYLETQKKITEAEKDLAWIALSAAINGQSPIEFNDTPGRKHSEVVEMWQRAIRSEKQKAGIEIEMPEKETVSV